MATIQAKVLTVKEKAFSHNNRKEKPEYYLESIYDKDFIYTQSALFQTYNSLELLKAFTQKKNFDYVEKNPIGNDGKKRRRLKNNVELLTEIVINFDKDIFEAIGNPKLIHQDAEKLAIDFFVKDLGFQILSVATHLDEHQKDEPSKRNYHTHITLLNYNLETHKTVKRTLSKKHLISIQNIISEQYKKYGFARDNNTDNTIAISINDNQQTNSNNSAKIVELETEINRKNTLIESLQEEIKELTTRSNNEQIDKLKEKNKNLTALIYLILEELNVSQDEISNMNFHAIEDMKDIVYKKLDMLKLYEFLNVGFAPTQEDIDLNTLEENFKKATQSSNSTINIKTEEF